MNEAIRIDSLAQLEAKNGLEIVLGVGNVTQELQ